MYCFLESPNFSQGHRSRSELVRLLDSRWNGGGFPCRFGSYLLSRGFGADTFEQYLGVAALRAAGGERGMVAADMAAELMRIAMVGQRQIAVRAVRLPAAVLAEHHIGRTAPVQKQQALLAAGQSSGHVFDEDGAEQAATAELAAVFQVDHDDARFARLGTGGQLVHAEYRTLLRFGHEIIFDRRCR